MKSSVSMMAAAGAAAWLAATPVSALPPHSALLEPPAARALMVPAQQKTYSIGELVIEGPWARATPGGAQVAGGYVKITNKGGAPDRLVGGTLALAGSVEVHEMSMSEGIMKMRHLADGLEIKPGQSVELKPGSFHIMFMGLREGLKEGRPVKGTLTFAKAGSIEVEFRVAPIGAKSGGQTQQHKHH